jgi:DinB superfamily
MPDVLQTLNLLRTVRERFVAAIAAVPDSRWQEAPREGVWSVAEVVTHVTQVERAINKNANRILREPPALIPFLRRLHPPVWLAASRVVRIKTTIPIKPEFLGDKAKLLASLTAARQLTADFLESNRDRDLSVYRAPHPIFGNLNLYEWHDFIAYHEERHRKQIREIVETFHL